MSDALTSQRDLLRSALLDIITITEPESSVHIIAQGALDAVPSELDDVEAEHAVEAERDRLRTVVWDETKLRASLAGARFARDEAIAERDRLRAVVDAANEEHAALWRVVNALRLHEQTVAANQDGAEQAIADRWQTVEHALDQLDGSGVMGAGELSLWSAEQAGEHYLGGSPLPVRHLGDGQQPDAEEGQGVPPVADHDDGDQ